ncbi:unnamed protein product [Brachionus calyciflorus]|uniref:EF-hand domain-containing protein n=1 Tax=Brachionus calyciflorus TaxID=104777 RepID=A0A813N628_9BILA|nr:unnamed protein product [Brachionus calyciflorus]
MGSTETKLFDNPKPCTTVAKKVYNSLPRRSKPIPKNLDTIKKLLSVQSGLSEEIITDICIKFLEKNPNGKMTKNEFIDLYCNLRPEPYNKLAPITEIIFNCFDRDKNGFIDLEEFIIAYAITTRGTIREKLSYAFDMYDSDGNGFLSYEEVRNVIEAMLLLLDSENKKPHVMKITQECMSFLDTSKDGKISKDEFINGLSKNYALRSIMTPFN